MKVEAEFVGGPQDGQRMMIERQLEVLEVYEPQKLVPVMYDDETPIAPMIPRRQYRLVGINDQGVRRYQFQP